MQRENNSLRDKCDILEKKVDSLVKFLENERRLRHDIEEMLKTSESKDKDSLRQVDKLQMQLQQAERELTEHRNNNRNNEDVDVLRRQNQDLITYQQELLNQNQKNILSLEEAMSKVESLERDN